MATETQYKFFRELYDEENERYGLLEGRVKVFITILTLYIGALVFKATEVEAFLKQHQISPVFGMASGLLFVVSLACCIFALRIKSYEGLADPEKVIDELPNEGVSDEEFLDDRIADLAVATNRNSKRNDEAARVLSAAGWLMFGGVLLQASTLLMTLQR